MNTGQRRPPPADPRRIELSYTHRHDLLSGVDDEPEIWHARAGVYTDDSDEPLCHVADLELVLIDPYRTSDLLAVLDSYDADLGLIAATVLHPKTGGLHPDLEARLELLGSRLLILHHVHLSPQWRGYGIGVLLAGLAIKRLSGGCQAAICYPAPLDWPEDEEAAQWQAAVAALSEVWSHLGFEHFSNGVHVLDLALVTLDEAIHRLQQRLERHA